MAGPILSLDDVSISFKTINGKVRAVRHVSLEVRRGECYALIGESGSGKSTLAFAAMGYLPANGSIESGRILFNGEDITGYSHAQLEKLRGKHVGMVFQNPHTAANPCYTIGDQLTEGIIYHEGISRAEAEERALAMLEAINIPDPKRILERYPHQISGGQKQRITIAQALLSHPDLIIMDEPTTALDVTTEIQFLRLLEDIRSRMDVAILYITHDMGIVARLADRVGVIYAGALVEEGSRETMFRNPEHPYTRGLMHSIPSIKMDRKHKGYSMPGLLPNLISLPPGCAFAPRCPVADEHCSAELPVVRNVPSQDGVEHRVFCHRPGAPLSFSTGVVEECVCHDEGDMQCSEPLLEVRNLKKYYEHSTFTDRLLRRKPRCVYALDDVSFTIMPGETLGVVGESGCGKSTLGKTILRLTEATGGSIFYKGEDITHKHSQSLCKSIQIVFQSPDSSLNPRHSLYTILSRPLLLHGLASGHAELEKRCFKLLDMVSLPRTYLYRKPHQLSGGEKQRVAIARAFAVHPSFVVCDEVTSALDVSVQASIINLLQDLQREFQTSYLFISHDLSAVREISQRIAVMYLGRLVEVGSTDQVFQPPYHPYTKALLSSISLPCIPQPHKSILLEGQIPSPANPPSGCRFRTRCYRRQCETCASVQPSMTFRDGHGLACHIDRAELEADTPVFPESFLS